MPVRTELPLPAIEDIKSSSFRAYPQQAGPILINRRNTVTVEAVRVGLIVLKAIGELFRLQIEVIKPLARCHPQSILPVVPNVAQGHADGALLKWICSESHCSTVVFDQ